METSINQFAENTLSFFGNVNTDLKNISPEAFGNEDDYKRFSDWIDYTFFLLKDLMNKDLIIASVNESIESDGTIDRKDAFDALNYELNYYNNRYAETSYSASPESYETGSIGINSIKDIIDKLPKWLQKVLTVISEALGIAKVLTGSPL